MTAFVAVPRSLFWAIISTLDTVSEASGPYPRTRTFVPRGGGEPVGRVVYTPDTVYYLTPALAAQVQP